MTARSGEFRVRRIVLALDPSAHDRATLAAAASLAARLDAELEALFVEDIDLLRSAELPFVRRTSQAAPAWRAFDIQAMERELRAMAAGVRTALAAEAERARLEWSFRVVRGRPESAAFAAGEDADLVVLARSPATRGGGARLSSPARQAAAHATRSVLLLRAAPALDRGVTVAYDGSPGAERALAAARRLAGDEALRVLVLAPSEPDARALEAEASEHLAGSGRPATFATLIAPDADILCAAGEEGGGVLVVSADSPLVAGEDAARRLDRARCPLLLVR